MYDCKLLLEECEDLRHVCEEIGSHENLMSELQFPAFTSRRLRESLERIVCLIKIYFTLVVRMACSPSSDFNNSVKGTTICSTRLSSLAYTLWKKIHTLKKSITQIDVDHVTRELEKGLRSEGTQTNKMSLANCENCDISKEIIKRLVVEVDELCRKSCVNSFIGKFRQELRLQLLEVTDWHSMTQLSEAITEDIKRLPLKNKMGAENNKKMRSESRKKLKEIIRNLEMQLGYGEKTSIGSDIKKLNKIIIDLKGELNKSREETQELRKMLELAEKSNKDLSDEILNLNRISLEDKEKVRNMEGKIADKIVEITCLMNKYEKELSESKKTIVNIKLENITKQKVIEEQLISLDNLERQLTECQTKEKKMNEIITTLNKGISNMEKNKAEKVDLQTQLKDKTEKEKKLRDKCKELQRELKKAKTESEKRSTANESEISMTGETEIDIKMQKVANENRIELLKTKNKKLESTLNKIQFSRGSKTKGTPSYQEIKIKNDPTYTFSLLPVKLGFFFIQ